jgi:hypothetical protein
VISAVSSRTRYPSPSPTRSVVASKRGTCFSHLHLPSKLVVPIFPPPVVTTDPNLGVRTLLHLVAISQQLLLFIPLSHIAPTLVLHCCDWSVASVFRSREFRGGGEEQISFIECLLIPLPVWYLFVCARSEDKLYSEIFLLLSPSFPLF